MGLVITYRGNQSNPISVAIGNRGKVIETFKVLYENMILVLLKAPLRTVHVFLFVSIF